MSSLNRAIIVGNLGQDPEVNYTKSDKAVCNFSVATSEKWKDKDGEKQEKTEWHRIVVFGDAAEACGRYLHKGAMVCVEGKLQTRQWDDKEGVTRFSTEIVAQNVQFLKTNKDEQGKSHTGKAPERKSRGNNEDKQSRRGSRGRDEDNRPNDDDVPF